MAGWGLSFGGSRSLAQITRDQVRRFTDTAHLAAHPVWMILKETMERTAGAWQSLEQKDLLPRAMREAIGRQIQTVIANSR